MKDMSENQWRYIEGFYFKNISTQIQMYDNTKVESVQLGQLLKSSIFVVQKAAAPKNWVEFRQKSTKVVRCSLPISYHNWRRRVMSLKLTGTDRQADRWKRPRIESGFHSD